MKIKIQMPYFYSDRGRILIEVDQEVAHLRFQYLDGQTQKN